MKKNMKGKFRERIDKTKKEMTMKIKKISINQQESKSTREKKEEKKCIKSRKTQLF